MVLTEATPSKVCDVTCAPSQVTVSSSRAVVSDVLIVGAGLAGSIAALVFARRGARVTVVDPHAQPRDNFRCDKLSPSQLALIEELGLSDCIEGLGTKLKKLQVVRNGISMMHELTEVACRYDVLIKAFRDRWPANVTFVQDLALDIKESADGPSVHLQSGRILTARLAILTTGHDQRLQRNIGLERNLLRTNQSLIFGFQMDAAARPKACESLIYCGQKAGDGIAYVNIFAFEDRTQVDLFTHKVPSDPWIHAFRRDPLPALHAVMPGLKKYMGNGSVLSPVRMAATHLWDNSAPNLAGVVLLGDAQLASCPVLGLGVTRILTGIRQLAQQHWPNWQGRAPLTRAQIEDYYSDPIIQHLAENSIYASKFVHSLSTRTGAYWRLRRLWPSVKDVGRQAVKRIRHQG